MGRPDAVPRSQGRLGDCYYLAALSALAVRCTCPIAKAHRANAHAWARGTEHTLAQACPSVHVSLISDDDDDEEHTPRFAALDTARGDTVVDIQSFCFKIQSICQENDRMSIHLSRKLLSFFLWNRDFDRHFRSKSLSLQGSGGSTTPSVKGSLSRFPTGATSRVSLRRRARWGSAT